ncbi:MAG: hypothetical protein HY906_27825 [Deltaproteobacteria bacterium]|nr:hypothetical protein [Deltaproteobacteria bacterium]
MRRLGGVTVRLTADSAVFELDTRIYPLDAVLGAAYMSINRTYVAIGQPRKHTVRVSFTVKPPLARDGIEVLCDYFCNELLCHVLRERTIEKYCRMREVLLAKALFAALPGADAEATCIAGPADAPSGGREEAPATAAPTDALSLADLPGENADYLDDPYGIAVPWEEKYARKGRGRKLPGGNG